MLISTLLVSARSGGSLVSSLRDIADTLETRKEVRREIRTLLAQSVITGYMVVAMGVGLLIMINTIRPGTINLMTRSLWAGHLRRRRPPYAAGLSRSAAPRGSSRERARVPLVVGAVAALAFGLFVAGYRLMRADAAEHLGVEDLVLLRAAARSRPRAWARSSGSPAGWCRACAGPSARPASPASSTGSTRPAGRTA